MSMTSPQTDAQCEICGREFPDQEQAAEHMTHEHGGPSGREPGGTGGLDPSFGSGPTGTTTSGGPSDGESARDSDDAGGTVSRTEGGAGRVQTE
jgi:hypothetical protein